MVSFVAGASLVAPSAEATRQSEFLRGPIVPGKSIGPLRLGMSEAAARRVLRRLDSGSRLLLRLRRGKATEYVEYTYPYEYSAYTVGYLGRPGKRRVAYIATHVDENKTREGIGVSNLETKLRRTYRQLTCTAFFGPGTPPGGRKEYVLGARSRRHTLFVISAGFTNGPQTQPSIVGRVVVREAFQRPEEGIKPFRCT